MSSSPITIQISDIDTSSAYGFIINGANADVKALATLNQLHNKGLIKKAPFATIEVGNYSAFYPRIWNECRTMTPEKYQWLLKKIEHYKYLDARKKADEEHRQRKLELKNKGS